jgi:hypothetical protein
MGAAPGGRRRYVARTADQEKEVLAEEDGVVVVSHELCGGGQFFDVRLCLICCGDVNVSPSQRVASVLSVCASLGRVLHCSVLLVCVVSS